MTNSSAPPAGANTAARDDVPTTALRVPDSRKRAISLKLTVIARQLGQRFDYLVEADGLTRGKWSVIVAVARSPGGTQRSIAAMLEITEVTAGQLIDRLCADGYLERREHPTDRRAYCVHLTPAAQPFLDKLGEVARIHEEETFAGLNEADLSRLDECLDIVARNFATSRSRDEKEKKSLGIRDRDRRVG
jgi:MarR family transcriptional regulator for hemolysin